MTLSLTPYSQIPATAIAMITKIIEQDEGGWALTSDSNDMDGGWTYGGMSSRLYAKYFHIVSYKDIIDLMSIDKETVRNRIISIYYTEFYVPLLDHAMFIYDFELSCAVNLGIDNVIRVRKEIKSVVSSQEYRAKFCKAWMDTYCQLVKKNAEAWKNWALALEDKYIRYDSLVIITMSPRTLRAEYLQGWWNRVARYLLVPDTTEGYVSPPENNLAS